MTKIRQKRFSNGNNQAQKKTLTLKAYQEVKKSQDFPLSLEEAYEIVGGYSQIKAKTAEARIVIYKRAFEMVQKDDAEFAKLLREDKVKPNKSVKKSLDLIRAYNIVGGYEAVDRKTFRQAVEMLKADKSDPEFAALLIKFAESHTSFSGADTETLAKVNEEGLDFFDNLDINKVVENVSKDKEIKEAQEKTPVTFNDDTSEAAEEEVNKVAHQGISLVAAAEVTMSQKGDDEKSFEEEVKEQTKARIISLRLEKVNEGREKAVIEAIKTNSEKPLSRFRRAMKNAWDFTKKISISSLSVARICDDAVVQLNKIQSSKRVKKLKISTKTFIANTEYTLHQLKPRGKAACLAALMTVSTFLSSCGPKQRSQGPVTYTQEQVDSIRKVAANEAVASYVAEQQKAQAKADAEAKAQAEAAAQAEQARLDSIQNMTVPHEWNDSMGIRSQRELDKIMNFYNQADSGRYDRMYRNLTLMNDSLPEVTQKDDSVATKVTPEMTLKRAFQQVSFQYNEDGSVRDAYVAAQNVIAALNPCDGEFQYIEGLRDNMQLLFDTSVPQGSLVVDKPYANKPDCGDAVVTHGSRRQEKTEPTVAQIDSVLTDSVPTINLGVASSFSTQEVEVQITDSAQVSLTKLKTSTNGKSQTTAVTNKGGASVDEAVAAGAAAHNNQDKVFVQNDDAAKTDSVAKPVMTLGVAGQVRGDSIIASPDSLSLTEHKTTTRADGSVISDDNKGTVGMATALQTGTTAQSNTQNVFINNSASSVADSVKTDSVPAFTLGVTGQVRGDSIDASAGRDSVAVQSVSSVAPQNFSLQNDTIGWTVYNENDSIPAGTPAAWGEMSGRGGWNYTSVTEKGIRDDKAYYGEDAYNHGIEVLTARTDLHALGQIFEGLTPQEDMRAIRNLMQWSAKKNGDFAKFREEAVALDEFIKGECKDSFTAEEATAIKSALAAVRANGTIDGVIGTKNTRNTSYALNEDCDKLGTPTFTTTTNAGTTRPSGPYLERKYAAPILRPKMTLGVASQLTTQEVEEQVVDTTDVSLRKLKTSTNGTGVTMAVTDKGGAPISSALAAGESAAQNTGKVFVAQSQTEKSTLSKREQRARRKIEEKKASQKLKAGQQRLQYWKNKIRH